MTASGSPLSPELTEQFVGVLEEFFLPKNDAFVVNQQEKRYSIVRDLRIAPGSTPTPTGLVPSVLRVEQFYVHTREIQPRYEWMLTHALRQDAPHCTLRWDGRLVFNRPRATSEEAWQKDKTFQSTVADEAEGQACLSILLGIELARHN